MSDSAYQVYQRYGTSTARGLFTPNPPTTPTGTQPIYIWFETDTNNTYLYATSWHLISGSASAQNAIDPFLLMGG